MFIVETRPIHMMSCHDTLSQYRRTILYASLTLEKKSELMEALQGNTRSGKLSTTERAKPEGGHAEAAVTLVASLLYQLKFSVFGRKPWTIVRRFDQISSAFISPHWKVLGS